MVGRWRNIMIALLLALIFHPQPCYAFPAQYDPFGHTYVTSMHFGTATVTAPPSDIRLWASPPITATVAYSATVDIARISLDDSLGLRNQEGVISARQDTPYTMYICEAGARPRTVYFPMMHT